MKIYVDSRHRTAGTNEDFVWQIPETVDIPDSQMYIDCVLVPNVFLSVKAGFNDRIHFFDEPVAVSGGAPTITPRRAILPPGQYNGISLAAAVETAMQSTSGFATQLTVTYDAIRAKLKITLSAPHDSQLRIFADGTFGEWNTLQTNIPVDPLDTKSAGKVCGFLGSETLVAATTIDVLGDSVVDVQRHHCVYIHSDLPEPGSSFGCRGQSDVIRRVVVDAPQNSLAIDRFTTSWDTVEVSSKSLRSMTFRLCDDNGATVDLQGHHWSFSLVFHDKL